MLWLLPGVLLCHMVLCMVMVSIPRHGRGDGSRSDDGGAADWATPDGALGGTRCRVYTSAGDTGTGAPS